MYCIYTCLSYLWPCLWVLFMLVILFQCVFLNIILSTSVVFQLCSLTLLRVHALYLCSAMVFSHVYTKQYAIYIVRHRRHQDSNSGPPRPRSKRNKWRSRLLGYEGWIFLVSFLWEKPHFLEPFKDCRLENETKEIFSINSILSVWHYRWNCS